MTISTELLPCPFCGETPDSSNANTFAVAQGDGGMSELAEKLRMNLLTMEFTERCKLVKEAADEIESLKAEVERLRQTQQWQPIETSPRDGEDILLVNEYGTMEVGYLCIGGHWATNDGEVFYPVYWMPLPEPPTSGAREG